MRETLDDLRALHSQGARRFLVAVDAGARWSAPSGRIRR